MSETLSETDSLTGVLSGLLTWAYTRGLGTFIDFGSILSIA